MSLATQIRSTPYSGGTARTKQEERHRLVFALFCLDTAIILVTVVAVDALRVWLENYLRIWPLATERHVYASILVAPVLLVLFGFQGLYDLDQILAGTREYARIANSVTYGLFGAVVISYFAGRNPLVSRLWLVLLWLFAIMTVSLGRFTARRVVRKLRQRGALRTRVAIVGASTLGIAIANQLTSAHGEGLDVVGFLDEYVPIGHRLIGRIAVVGRPDELARGALADLADEYILVPQALPAERLDQITRLMVARGGPTVRMAVSPSELLTNGVLVAQRGNVPLVTLRQAQITGVDAALKRGLDLAGAALGIIVLAPLFLAVILRSRLRGDLNLFESHAVHIADEDHARFWLLGKAATSWLPVRGYPALFAVLRGTLSLVGPRPIDCNTPLADNPGAVVVAKPGLTGPWRVHADAQSLADQALLDLAYVRNYTIWEDLRILVETVRGIASSPPKSNIGRWHEPGHVSQRTLRT